ncbi:MAG: hypothetical protein RLZZ258_127 [Actinomycetota bacterium]|jgi:hypothetical protein
MAAPRKPRPASNAKKPNFAVRRIVALVLVVAIVAVVWSLLSGLIGLVTGMFAGAPAASPSPSSSVSASAGASSTPSASSAAGPICERKSVSIEALVADQNGASKDVFTQGENPFFGYRITNNSTETCFYEVGTAQTFFVVSTDGQVIWDSHDCDRTAVTSVLMQFKPGESRTSAFSDWARVFSSAAGCGADQTPATNGTVYGLSAIVNGATSSSKAMFSLE